METWHRFREAWVETLGLMLRGPALVASAAGVVWCLAAIIDYQVRGPNAVAEELWIAVVYGAFPASLVFFGVLSWQFLVGVPRKKDRKKIASLEALQHENAAEIERLRAAIEPKPDMSIKELFLHVCPQVLEDSNNDIWEEVGDEIRDKLHEGAFRSWGRPVPLDGISSTGRESSREIPKDYWAYVDDWTYYFFADNENAAHTSVRNVSLQTPYGDIRVNRSEVLGIWPSSQ